MSDHNTAFLSDYQPTSAKSENTSRQRKHRFHKSHLLQRAIEFYKVFMLVHLAAYLAYRFWQLRPYKIIPTLQYNQQAKNKHNALNLRTDGHILEMPSPHLAVTLRQHELEVTEVASQAEDVPVPAQLSPSHANTWLEAENNSKP
ncbi:hypothetical protein NXS19_013265 [Fusarium pseudograminearum]|nr:hypothetical protein NXS19_013265 [Fusarium pseudograminearum]